LYATLKGPRTYSVEGYVFRRGVEVPVPRSLEDIVRSRRQYFDYRDVDEEQRERERMESEFLDMPQDEKDERIRKATLELDPDNEDHFTKSGKPQVDALSSVLGFRITSEDRDRATSARLRKGGVRIERGSSSDSGDDEEAVEV